MWENYTVTVNEDAAGVLDVNGTFPIFLTLTDEQAERLQTLNDDNQVIVMEIANFTYEEG